MENEAQHIIYIKNHCTDNIRMTHKYYFKVLYIMFFKQYHTMAYIDMNNVELVFNDDLEFLANQVEINDESDTGFNYTGFFKYNFMKPDDENIALYILHMHDRLTQFNIIDILYGLYYTNSLKERYYPTIEFYKLIMDQYKRIDIQTLQKFILKTSRISHSKSDPKMTGDIIYLILRHIYDEEDRVQLIGAIMEKNKNKPIVFTENILYECQRQFINCGDRVLDMLKEPIFNTLAEKWKDVDLPEMYTLEDYMNSSTTYKNFQERTFDKFSYMIAYGIIFDFISIHEIYDFLFTGVDMDTIPQNILLMMYGKIKQYLNPPTRESYEVEDNNKTETDLDAFLNSFGTIYVDEREMVDEGMCGDGGLHVGYYEDIIPDYDFKVYKKMINNNITEEDFINEVGDYSLTYKLYNYCNYNHKNRTFEEFKRDFLDFMLKLIEKKIKV